MYKRILNTFNKYKNSKILVRTLCISLVVTFTILTSVLIIVFDRTQKQNDKSWINEARSNLYQINMLNELTIGDISDYLTKSLNDYELRALMYNKNYTRNLSIRSHDIYKSLTDLSDLINNIQIINFNTQTVLDQFGRKMFEIYPDKSVFDLLSEITPSASIRLNDFYPRIMQTSEFSPKVVNQKVISLVYYQHKAGAFVLNLDYNKLKDVLLHGNDSRTQYYLVNKNGTIFLSSNDEFFGKNIDDIDTLKQLFHRSSEEKILYIEDADGKSVASCTHSGIFFSHCISVTGLTSIVFGSQPFWLLMVLCFAALIISLLVSVVIARFSIKPLWFLYDGVRRKMSLSEESSVRMVDEVMFLDDTYNRLLTDNEKMRENVTQYQHIRENQTLMRLMDPDDYIMSTPAVAIAELETQLPYKHYRVISLMTNARNTEDDNQRVQHAIAAVACGKLQALGVVRAVFPTAIQIIILLNTQSDDTYTLRPVLELIRTECLKLPDYSAVFIGVGEDVCSLDELTFSYHKAVQASQLAYINQYDEVLFSDDPVFDDDDTDAEPIDWGAEIPRALKQLNCLGVSRMIESYFKNASRHGYHQFILSIMVLDSLFKKTETALNKDVIEDYAALELTTVARWNVQDAIKQFVNRAQEDISRLAGMKEIISETDKLVDRISEMIETGIGDPNFSINQISDELSISLNYMRTLYKAKSGESPTDRLNRRRLEKACDLLCNSDMTIASISADLGFTTPNYFFAFFKKHIGMTPGQYRAQRVSNEVSSSAEK